MPYQASSDGSGQAPAVELRQVVKRFGDTTAVDGLTFQAASGAVLGLLGPNGSGKTTTISILSTLLVADEGDALVAGVDVRRDPRQVRQIISLTGQFAAVDGSLTGRENLVLFGRLRGLGGRAAAARADELLEEFDLADAADRRAATYSGGMRRRLDLAASLVVAPRVLFLDEPTTGLDPRSRASLWAVVRRLRQEGISIILTTQYLEEADLLADRIVVIYHGSVIAEGTADELKVRTGGTACVVAPVDAARVGEVADLLGPLGAVTVDEERAAVSLPAADGAATLSSALALLGGAGIEVADAGLRRPTLDEVYLTLTEGRTAGAGANQVGE